MFTSSSQMWDEKTPFEKTAKTTVQPDRRLIAQAYSALSEKGCQTYLVGAGERLSV